MTKTKSVGADGFGDGASGSGSFRWFRQPEQIQLGFADGGVTVALWGTLIGVLWISTLAVEFAVNARSDDDGGDTVFHVSG